MNENEQYDKDNLEQGDTSTPSPKDMSGWQFAKDMFVYIDERKFIFVIIIALIYVIWSHAWWILTGLAIEYLFSLWVYDKLIHVDSVTVLNVDCEEKQNKLMLEETKSKPPVWSHFKIPVTIWKLIRKQGGEYSHLDSTGKPLFLSEEVNFNEGVIKFCPVHSWGFHDLLANISSLSRLRKWLITIFQDYIKTKIDSRINLLSNVALAINKYMRKDEKEITFHFDESIIETDTPISQIIKNIESQNIEGERANDVNE